jgi:predicted GIY-YIG superfamily endonuclease/predicted acetyltransferase
MERECYIYVLHFEENLHHAQHYIGCTQKIAARLDAHANGAAARLTQVLDEKGIHWKLGGLYRCNLARMRKLERHLKNQHNSRRYCQLCTSPPYVFTGTLAIDVAGLTFPTESAKLRKGISRTITTRFTTAEEPPETTQFIKELGHREKDAVGFIPAGGPEGLSVSQAAGRICLAEIGGVPIGYAAVTVNNRDERVTIQQCVVRDEFRLFGAGRMMVERICNNWPTFTVVANVRDDLAANHFWEAIGFTLDHTWQHHTSKSKINHYQRQPSNCTDEIPY